MWLAAYPDHVSRVRQRSWQYPRGHPACSHFLVGSTTARLRQVCLAEPPSLADPIRGCVRCGPAPHAKPALARAAQPQTDGLGLLLSRMIAPHLPQVDTEGPEGSGGEPACVRSASALHDILPPSPRCCAAVLGRTCCRLLFAHSEYFMIWREHGPSPFALFATSPWGWWASTAAPSTTASMTSSQLASSMLSQTGGNFSMAYPCTQDG